MITRTSSVVSALFILIVFWGCASYPPLLKAAYDGDVAGVQDLIKEGRDVNMKVGRLDETALIVASGQGHLDTVKYLLDHGADVNQHTRNRESALIRATWGCHRDVAKLLIANGADVNIQNQDYGMTPLMFAVECGDIEMSKYLIQLGADVTIENKSGISPLKTAVWQNNAKLAEILIDAGIDINVEQNEETSPLYEAAANGCISAVSLLIRKGAKVDFINSYNGWTPLMIALSTNHFAIVSKLIKAGADVNSKDRNGYTPLLYAAYSNWAPMVKILCENGADVNAQESAGFTPLHFATIYQFDDIAAILLMHHASVDIADKKGHRALWYAEKNEDAKIISMLKNPDPAFLAAFVPDTTSAGDDLDGVRMDNATLESVRSAKPLGTSYDNIVFHPFKVPDKLKKDYLDAAIRCEQTAMAHLKRKSVYGNITKKADPPYGNDTVLVDGFIEDIYYAGKGRRILFGPLAGMPFMNVRIRLTDAESETVIHEKVISTNANVWFAGATGGTSDKYLPDTVGEIIGEYLYTVIPAGPLSDW